MAATTNVRKEVVCPPTGSRRTCIGAGVRKTRITSGLLRYPGGKAKLLGALLPHLRRMAAEVGPDAEYREPFFGGGAVGLGLLAYTPTIRRAWINDRDPAMAKLWNSVIHERDSLTMLIELFPETIRLADDGMEYFQFYKRLLLSIEAPEDTDRYPPALVALQKLVAHQLSFSGLGTRAGGAMTDRLSRYSPSRLNEKIDQCHNLLSGIALREDTCTCLDFEELFEPGEAIIYLDPPYYQAGPSLYQFSFGPEDHAHLAELLRAEGRPWLLSYDSHPVVHELYERWSHFQEVQVGYSINGSARKSELLISNIPFR